jgi:hypothetical protein
MSVVGGSAAFTPLQCEIVAAEVTRLYFDPDSALRIPHWKEPRYLGCYNSYTSLNTALL